MKSIIQTRHRVAKGETVGKNKKGSLLGLILAIAYLAGNNLGFAKALNPALRLSAIKAIKTAEAGGDELYLDVTVYPSHGKPSHRQIPMRPLYWSSKALKNLKVVNLWSAKLEMGQTVTLIVSLVEHDVPPWNTDDLIGAVRIHVKNDAGILQSQWSMVNQKPPQLKILKENVQQTFQLTGEQSIYKLDLRLE